MAILPITIFRPAGADAVSLATTRQKDALPSSIEGEVVSLFDELRVPVFRYLLSNRVPAPDAEEILQEVFLLLFQHLRRGKSRDNLAGWIFRTAHHYLLKHREKSRRHAERFDATGPDLEPVAGLSPRADVICEDAQRRENLLAVVRALPEQDQRCLSLRAEGLRYREIAEILGVSLGTVANSLQRSIARIARADER